MNKKIKTMKTKKTAKAVKAPVPAKKTAAAPVMAPAKVIKVFSKLPKSELNFYRKLLEEKKADLMNEVEKRIKEGQESERGEVMDSADQALDSYESELHFGINDNERKFLEDVELAILRIQEGIFGICSSCSQSISKERLKAMPSARMCIGCKQAQERVRVS
jgi:DnaK suppressor protein